MAHPEKPRIATDETLFGSLVESEAAALATPAALPSIAPEDEADAEAMTVVAYEEPELPRESERRRLHTDRIRARRIEAVRRHQDTPTPARVAPLVRPTPAPARPPRRPTVPARRPPTDWAQERTAMPEAYVATMCSALSTHRGTVDPDARLMTMVSMMLSAVAGVFLAAALATLL